MMANTQITYMYRDASNWKQFETVVLAGAMSQEDIDLIISKLEDGDLFIPEQVGLPRLQFRWPTLNEDDHVYHELKREDFEIVDLPPTLEITAKELVENFRNVNWDILFSDWTLWSHGEIDENADFDNPVW
jgi:hypothetical protein